MIHSLDELKFQGGYPTAESIQKLYDQLDLQRAAQAYTVLLGRKPIAYHDRNYRIITWD